jgi:hypothetical protein
MHHAHYKCAINNRRIAQSVAPDCYRGARSNPAERRTWLIVLISYISKAKTDYNGNKKNRSPALPDL